jgi:hypothetical protein
MSIAEIRILRWMSRVSREDRIRNEYVRGSSVYSGEMTENKLRWFGHVIRRKEINAARVVMKINIERKRGRGRPKKG